MSALAGLDQALWDLEGPSARPAGLADARRQGARQDPVLCLDRTAIGRMRSARPRPRRKAQGFYAVKMNATAELDWIGTTKLFDEMIVKRVEAAQAQGMDVGLDFHGRVHRPIAKQLAKVLEPLGLLFIEEPLLSENMRRTSRDCGAHHDSDRAWRAALLKMGVQAVFRARRGGYHPARPQPRRRDSRGAQDRSDGGSL